ncbi:hypothetical protein DFH06DRAFT_1296275 [Mycena polygramma]|nr:hypothetical protein DFH06DRAFT_1296275 [Mycena polygramma]
MRSPYTTGAVCIWGERHFVVKCLFEWRNSGIQEEGKKAALAKTRTGEESNPDSPSMNFAGAGLKPQQTQPVRPGCSLTWANLWVEKYKGERNMDEKAKWWSADMQRRGIEPQIAVQQLAEPFVIHTNKHEGPANFSQHTIVRATSPRFLLFPSNSIPVSVAQNQILRRRLSVPPAYPDGALHPLLTFRLKRKHPIWVFDRGIFGGLARPSITKPNSVTRQLSLPLHHPSAHIMHPPVLIDTKRSPVPPDL